MLLAFFYDGLSLPVTLRAAASGVEKCSWHFFYDGLSLPVTLWAAASGVEKCSWHFFVHGLCVVVFPVNQDGVLCTINY
ncbi:MULTISPECIES: hypothetical protein [unclassified Brenneria]|uniref:hypothetical protein n=1 Tax=unclassified Brenneria TaxID=2634434 RepID=UPI001552C85B|nr:hypothetical protein [Brenneria sp. hezel4-2-4]MEE3650811.1 hypothetical protein [Brenneria sp. HEZEL_4_2_4]NPD00766.1 hypothetical protein [Brenneria sp. hezel4-2-4]